MKKIQQLIGGAGTGKTTRNMRSIAEIVDSGIMPMEILFSSFTKVARQTAATRAQDITGYSASDLMQEGWFRTLQSVCYRCLGVKSSDMLADNKSTRQWFSDLFQVDFSKQSIESEDGYIVDDGMDNSIGSVIKEWSVARMMLITADDEDRWPVKSMDRQKSMAVIADYERKKRVDGKLDFADLALKFVGIEHQIHGLRYGRPECGIPDVGACIFDEYQDTPELLHLVAKRIAESPQVEHVVVSGDPFQSIFSFVGSDHRFLMSGFDYTERETMSQSFRCAAKILETGEQAIRNCSDYFDRGIKPKDETGHLIPHTARSRDPLWTPSADEDWLVVGRTNHAVSRVTKWLTDNDIPWIASDSTDNKGAGYIGPRKRRVGELFWKIRNNWPISGHEWGYAIADIPVSIGDVKMLKRGVKAAAMSSDWRCPPRMAANDVVEHGATSEFVGMLRNTDWSQLDPAFVKFLRVADKHGPDLAISPKVRASTIHGAKGDEADNVLLYTQSSNVVRSASNNTRKIDEEHRTWYVGATRARDVLTLFKFAGDRPGYFA